MVLFVKGKHLRNEGDEAVVQLSEEELGRAILNYIVNSENTNIGAAFMQNLFSSRPMSLSELISSRNVIVREPQVETFKNVDSVRECNVSSEPEESTQSIERRCDDIDRLDVKKKSTSVVMTKEDKIEYIELLKEKDDVIIASKIFKLSCPSIYEKIVGGKSITNSAIIENCNFVIKFDKNGVMYSFKITNNGEDREITPSNNVVFEWEKATITNIEELLNI